MKQIEGKTGELITTGELVSNSELAALSSDRLRARLAEVMTTTAEGLREMASIVGELERRGEDLSDLRIGIVDHLRRIASGQLLAEVVIKCAGQPRLLSIAARLPLEDQRRLVSGQPFDLAVWRSGKIEWRKIDPLSATPSQLMQLFHVDRVRTQSEQVSLLEQSGSTARPKKTTVKAKAKADPIRNGIKVGRSFVPLEDVLLALAELAQADYDDTVEDEEASVAVRLSAAQHQQLRARAAKSKSTMAFLIRRAMAAAGLFAPTVDTEEE